ncbi:MAG: plastocyanin/azurin family copper-binding protein [Haloarculaceae archaeon]
MTDPTDRRRFVKYLGAAAGLGTTALAGCTATANTKPGEESIQKMSEQVDIPQVVGGPNDLKSEATVHMVAVEGNEGNGFGYMPAVLWVEPGATVTWKHTANGPSERVSHTVTSMNKGNEKPQFTPKHSAPFDSGVIAGVGPWKDENALRGEYQTHTNGQRPNGGFQGPYKVTFSPPKFPQGVYMYMCEDHMYFGMVAAIVVGNVGPGDPGWSPGMTMKPMPMFTDPFKQHLQTIRTTIKNQVNGQ